MQPNEWPDLSDTWLLGELDEWLVPFLDRATSRSHLAKVDVTTALWNQIGYHRKAEVDRLAPETLEMSRGRDRTIDYTDERASVSVRPQQVFGWTKHPCVVDGAVPLVLELLSPADRPIQITADLPGFWAGSWADVRKGLGRSLSETRLAGRPGERRLSAVSPIYRPCRGVAKRCGCRSDAPRLRF